jgi:hypothetical protein
VKRKENAVGNASRSLRTLALLASVATLPGFAGAQSVSRLGNVNFAVDDAGVHVENVDLGGHYPFGAYMERIGVPMQTTPTLATLATGDAGATRGLWRDTADDWRGVAGQASVVQADGRIRSVGDAAWRFDPWRGARVELLAAGDLVSADESVAYGFLGSSVARALGGRVTAEALAGVQSFTDGNARLHLRAGLVWEALPRYGINVQWRWRQYESTKDAASVAYFNPSSYSDNQVAAGIRARLGAWTVSAAVGGGVETINGSETRPVGTAEVRGEAALSDKLRVAIYAGYDRSLDYGEAAGDASRQICATLTHPF